VKNSDPQTWQNGEILQRLQGSKVQGIFKMKNLNDQFSDEEKQHLNYLGSILGRPNTPEEQEIEDIWAAMEKGRNQPAGQDVQQSTPGVTR
jgi:hypothetical protein